jgi:hypothetical protein
MSPPIIASGLTGEHRRDDTPEKVSPTFEQGGIMRLRFLGTDSEKGGCPTLYATDRGTYVVQGWAVTDPEALGDLRDILEGESFVEIPREVLRFAGTDRAREGC